MKLNLLLATCALIGLCGCTRLFYKGTNAFVNHIQPNGHVKQADECMSCRPKYPKSAH